jgi:excisionase family DNA binding protein
MKRSEPIPTDKESFKSFSINARDDPLLLTAEQVAKLLQVSKRTLWRLLSAGALPAPLRIGNSTRWGCQQIHHWIDAGCPSPSARENSTERKK